MKNTILPLLMLFLGYSPSVFAAAPRQIGGDLPGAGPTPPSVDYSCGAEAGISGYSVMTGNVAFTLENWEGRRCYHQSRNSGPLPGTLLPSGHVIDITACESGITGVYELRASLQVMATDPVMGGKYLEQTVSINDLLIRTESSFNLNGSSRGVMPGEVGMPNDTKLGCRLTFHNLP